VRAGYWPRCTMGAQRGRTEARYSPCIWLRVGHAHVGDFDICTIHSRFQSAKYCRLYAYTFIGPLYIVWVGWGASVPIQKGHSGTQKDHAKPVLWCVRWGGCVYFVTQSITGKSCLDSMARLVNFDWRTIGALNAVSAMAQVGQFGVSFVMLPVWLAGQGLDASGLGMFAASLWLGQFPGLAFAPGLSRRFGERSVIACGLLCTVCAFAWIAFASWPALLAGGLLAGFGLGLRWIGLEPWLYQIAPAEARGRLVGFHETLIALAPIVAPLLGNFFGLQGYSLFWIGTFFTLGAMVPLAIARRPIADHWPLLQGSQSNPENYSSKALPIFVMVSVRERIFRQGAVIALLGGMMEAAVSGLFALYTQGRGLSLSQTADLLAVFGLGGLLLQFAVGWLADHRGVGLAAIVCAAATLLLCTTLSFPHSYEVVVVAVFLLGGFITAFLTLALIASTLTKSGNMASNVSSISMLYTLSAVAGPLVASATIKSSSTDALMWFTAVAATVMGLLLLKLER